MSSRFKVLPLDFPFTADKRWWEDCVEESKRIQPVFNRNGFYLDRYTGQAWLEINGEAWQYNSRKGFEYDLEISEGNNWMEDRIYNALAIICSTSMADKRLIHRYSVETDRRLLKRSGVTARLSGLHLRKRFAAFKQRKGLVAGAIPQ